MRLGAILGLILALFGTGPALAALPEITGRLTYAQILDACGSFPGQRIVVVVGKIKGFVACDADLLARLSAIVSADPSRAQDRLDESSGVSGSEDSEDPADPVEDTAVEDTDSDSSDDSSDEDSSGSDASDTEE